MELFLIKSIQTRHNSNISCITLLRSLLHEILINIEIRRFMIRIVISIFIMVSKTEYYCITVSSKICNDKIIYNKYQNKQVLNTNHNLY